MKFLKLVAAQFFVAATTHALTLEQARGRAETNNPAFQVLQSEIAAAEGAKTGAGMRTNPELTIGPGVVRSTGEGRTSYRVRGELGFSQTFEFPGKRTLRILLADGEIGLRRLALDGFRQQLGIEVRRVFLQALVAREISVLRAEQLRTAETFLKSAKNRVAGGYASTFESVQAQADVIAASKGVSQVRGRTRLAKLKLAELMGSPTDTSFDVEGNLDGAVGTTVASDPFALALAKNPAIKASALRVELADQAVQAARMASKPDLTVNPALEVSRDEQALSLNLSVPLPIWNNGRAGVATAEAQKRRAAGEMERLKQELSAAIHASRERVANASEQLDLYTPGFLGDLRSIMLRAEKVYDQNATSLLVYLESRRGYFNSLSDHLETIGQLADARSELATAIGVAQTDPTEPDALEKP